jgi:hypothetical protein
LSDYERKRLARDRDRLQSAELTAAWEEWLAALRKREAAGPAASQERLEPVAG